MLDKEDKSLVGLESIKKLDPVGSTVRYEVMKLIIDVTWSVEGIYAFIY